MEGYHGNSGNLYPPENNNAAAYGYPDPLTDGSGDDVYYDAIGTDQQSTTYQNNSNNRTDILKLILYDLNSAIAPRDIRLLAIQTALEEFDQHDDELLHDEELELRADHILLQKLTYAMCIDARSIEVGYICSAMEAVYRAGRTRLAQSFHEICDALLPLFVEMIRPPVGYMASVELLAGKGNDNGGTLDSVRESGVDVTTAAEGGVNTLLDDMNQHPSETMQDHDANNAPSVMNYGDYDEESAESVEIPSGTGEYFEQMNRMSSAAGSHTAAYEEEAAAAAAEENRTVPEVDQSETDAIPPGTGEYFEEMKRRTSDVGAEGQPGAAAVATNALVPKPSVGGNVNDQTLVLNMNAGEVEQTQWTPPPQKVITMGQGEDQPGHGATNETIRMELDDAKQALKHQMPVAASAPVENHKRLSIESELAPSVPVDNRKRLSVESMATTQQMDNTEMHHQQHVHQQAQQGAVINALEAEENEAMNLRGGGIDDDDDDEGTFGEDNDTMPNFDPSSYHSEFNDLVRGQSGGSAAEGGGPANYEDIESQDNPFSDTSSFYGSVKSSFKSYRRSSVGGFSENNYGGGNNGSVGVDAFSERKGRMEQGEEVSETSSFKNYGGSSVGGGAFGENKGGQTEHEGEDNMSAHNPFSDTASFQNYGGGSVGYGGSSVGGFSENRGGGGHNINMDRANKDHFSPPRIDEYSESGSNGHQQQGGFDSSPNNIHDEYNGEDSAPGSVPQGSSGFDEHGGYSGAAPAIFTGYNDDDEGAANSFVNSENKTGEPSQTSASYDRSAATSYDRSGGPGYNEQENKYSSSQGYEGINHHKFHSDPSGFSDGADMRRQSDITDEWGDQSAPPMESGSMGGGGQFGEDRNDNMYMSIEEHLLPEEQPDPYFPEPVPTGQFQIDEEEQESKYSEFPYEGDNNLPTRGIGQDEDIFQFQEPRLSMTSQDYFNYSDPVEGEICPLAVRKVLKILRYFSRVLSAMEPLAQHTGLVDALLYHMTKKPLSDDYDEEISSRVDAIAVVVNLACAEENKIMLVYHPGLLDAIIKIANHDPIDEAREHAAIVLMNLAYAEENKVHMVNQDHLLDTLVHLLSDVSPFTRRYASAALFTLACTYANTAVMARHCDGGILEALRRVLLNDAIDEARVNAAEALFNMARNNSDDTVENMGNHPRLLASLSHSVLTDYSADVRAYSARALEWLSADIHHPMPCHRILLKALTMASQWTKTTCIAEALKMQASLSENRKPMVEHPGLLDALATLSLLDGITDDEVKTCAISAIERLSKEASTRHIMVKNEGVMTALTKATFANDGAEDDAPNEGTPTALLMKTALKNLSLHL
mmetsp:Transcript_21992/g.47793  ORF Transcript_21992/g.47793 Transcript_21992/m.47793 type:complete len:1334 (-) Transcript_21992:75-4076(-)